MATKRAEWMEGNWGLRFLLPGMRQPGKLKQFNVEAIMDQIKALASSAKWVQINVTQGANGSCYTCPLDILSDHVSEECVPDRDLFGEMLDALIEAGFRVVAYFASEGPTGKCNSDKGMDVAPPGSVDKWKALCQRRGMEPKEAVAKLIVRPISRRYGNKISGWWFDHAHFGDIQALAHAARSGNPHAALTFNYVEEGRKHNEDGSRKLQRGVSQEDYTCGHPTPVTRQLPSWDGNANVIAEMEVRGAYLDGSLAHMFIPMQEKWYGGDPCFTKEKVVEWTLRVVKAGGAITWATALEGHNIIPQVQLEQLNAINEAVAQWKTEMEGDFAVKDSV